MDTARFRTHLCRRLNRRCHFGRGGFTRRDFIRALKSKYTLKRNFMTASPIVHQYEYIVQETDLDTFGHVNHANYLRIFEQARWEWISTRGYGLDVVREKQIGPTILEVNVQYKRELKQREKIRIETVCSEHKGKISQLMQKMFNERGEICCVINLTVGLFDMQKRKLISATPEWLYALGFAEQ
jgi:thioesterase III